MRPLSVSPKSKHHENVNDISHEKYTDDEQDECGEEFDSFNEKQLLFNKYMQDSLNYFSENSFKCLISQLTNSLIIFEKDPKDYEKVILLKSNLGVVWYYNKDYAKAQKYLSESLKLLESTNTRPPHLMNELTQTLFLRICCNGITVNIAKGDIEMARFYNMKLNSLLVNAPETRKFFLIKETIYILYRFTGLADLHGTLIKGIEPYFEGPLLGCFYNILGLNREFDCDYTLALRYFKVAFEIWNNLKETYYMLLTLKHIVSIYQQFKFETEESNKYYQFWNTLINMEHFQNLDLKVIFDNYEKKIKMSMEITANIKRFDVQLKENVKFNKDFLLIESGGTGNLNEDKLIWQHAVRFRLMKALKLSMVAMNKNKQKLHNFSIVEEQIIDLINRIESENNPLILFRIQNSPYVRDSITLFKCQIAHAISSIAQIVHGKNFEHLRLFALKKKHNSLKLDYLLQENRLYTKAQKMVKIGFQLIKVHYHSSGSKKKYIKVYPDGYIRWAKSENDLLTSKKVRQCNRLKLCYL